MSSLPNWFPEVYGKVRRCDWIFCRATESADSRQQWRQQQAAGACTWRPAGAHTVLLRRWPHLESQHVDGAIIKPCGLAYSLGKNNGTNFQADTRSKWLWCWSSMEWLVTLNSCHPEQSLQPALCTREGLSNTAIYSYYHFIISRLTLWVKPITEMWLMHI